VNWSFFFAPEIGTHYKPISPDHGVVKRYSTGADTTTSTFRLSDELYVLRMNWGAIRQLNRGRGDTICNGRVGGV
jgi:hypothetical protein